MCVFRSEELLGLELTIDLTYPQRLVRGRCRSARLALPHLEMNGLRLLAGVGASFLAVQRVSQVFEGGLGLPLLFVAQEL